MEEGVDFDYIYTARATYRLQRDTLLVFSDDGGSFVGYHYDDEIWAVWDGAFTLHPVTDRAPMYESFYERDNIVALVNEEDEYQSHEAIPDLQPPVFAISTNDGVVGYTEVGTPCGVFRDGVFQRTVS